MMLAPLLIGLLGSLHCVGMCGPLALAVPFPAGKRLSGIFLYHLGKILTYTFLGLLLSSIGISISLIGWQKGFSIIIGVVLLLSVAWPHFHQWINRPFRSGRWISWIRQSITRQFKKRTMTASLAVGILNGLLPCGLVYIAIVGALTSEWIWQGGLYMALFGMGTMPAMLLLQGLPHLSRHYLPWNSRLVTSALSVLTGILMIFRGLAVEIPALTSALARMGLEHITFCH